MLISVAFAAAALAAAQPLGAPPPDAQPMDGAWRVAGHDEMDDMGRVALFVEPASIQREGDRVRFRADMRPERSSVGADSVVIDVSASCTSGAHQVLGAGFYNRRALLRAIPELPPEQGQPGTNIQVMINAACAGQWISDVVDREAYARTLFGRR